MSKTSRLVPLRKEDTCNIQVFDIVRDEECPEETFEYSVQSEDMYRRYKKFQELNSVCKHLILKMYGSFENYMEAEEKHQTEGDYQSKEKHPFEEIVFLLYKFWDSESTIRAIASRIGIFIGFDDIYTASEILLDKLVSILEKKPDIQLIKKVIDISEKDFKKFALNVPEEDFESVYQNRLIFMLDI